MKIIFLFILAFSYLRAGECSDTLFTFDIPKQSSNVKIIDIVENMAGKCKFSVKIKDDEASEALDNKLFLVHIEDYTLDDMFDFLFTQNNIFYSFDKDKNVLSISYLETKSFVIDYVNLKEYTTESTKSISVGVTSQSNTTSSTEQTSSSSGNSDSTTIFSKSEFKFWSNLSGDIDSILSRDGDNTIIKSRSIINPDAGVVTITGTRDQINRIDKYLNKLKNRLHKQVVLEAKLLEVTYTDVKNKGIDWSKFQTSINGSLPDGTWINSSDIGSNGSGHFSYNFSIDGLLSFLDTYGDVNVLSTPKIMTLNNQPAVINVGQQINYTTNTTILSDSGATTSDANTESVFVGLTLNIVPEITDNGYVVLKINPVISEPLDVASNFDANGVRIMPPDTKIKQLSSIVKTKNNQRVVIGGLVSYSRTDDKNQVQLLGDIPILGYAFKSETSKVVKKELIIVVTPTIVDYDKFPSIDNVESMLNLEGR